MGIRGEIFSTRSSTRSDKRTYFFNVKENRTGDLFLNIVETKKEGESEFERQRHQIVVFREDLPAFMKALNAAVGVMKTNRAGSSSGGSGRPPGA